MKHLFFSGVIILLLFVSPVYSQNYQETELGAKISLPSQEAEIQFFNSSIVRILKYPKGTAINKESVSVIKTPEDINLNVSQAGNVVSLKSATLQVNVNVTTGKVSFSDLVGNNLFSEKDNGTVFTAITEAEKNTYNVHQAFSLDANEAIYGFGQQQTGKMNQRNQTLELKQFNTKIAIPFFQSTKGYGVFWDNYSITTFTDNAQETSLSSEVADCADYYFMYGNNMDGVIACMRDLTGQAPLFPLWTWGYWQSKEKYISQDEVIGVVQKYRDLKVPLDGIVQDWQYWSTDDTYWNAMEFGNPNYPNPAKMISDIHNLNAHTIFSVWPSFGEKTKPYKELDEKGLLFSFKTYPFQAVKIYNAYDAEARDIYWSYMNKNMFSIGIDGWWLDATEPEYFEETTEQLDEETGMGSFRSVRNAFPIKSIGGVHDSQRKVTDSKRVTILTRSAFAGQQRYGSTLWSGDLYASWQTFQNQIPSGLNFSATAIPYWNTDIGGFWVKDGTSSHADYRELYVRWLQYGTFNSMMRSHGTTTPREIWQFGKSGDWAYDAIERFIRLRYLLLPYNYSLSWDVTSNSGSIMRMLAMDFPEDDKVLDMGTEYMYGKAFLVAPVLNPFYTSGERENSTVDFSEIQTSPVYLPKGTGWYDFWTGKRIQGGVEFQRETPIDIMPIYVKAGSIVPIGPDVQYAEEKPWDDLEIRVYPGADANFVLYEDEKDNYNYESGVYSTIPFIYNEAEKSLTVGNRSGNYPGMLTNRTFKIIKVKEGYGAGDAHSTVYDSIVTYSGSEVKIIFDKD